MAPLERPSAISSSTSRSRSVSRVSPAACPDFAPINHNTITNNLIATNNAGIGFCVYGGGTPGKPYSSDPTNATYVVYRNNVFQRGANGKCGTYGPVTHFVSGRTGNEWTGNIWDNGTTVPPDN